MPARVEGERDIQPTCPQCFGESLRTGGQWVGVANIQRNVQLIESSGRARRADQVV